MTILFVKECLFCHLVQDGGGLVSDVALIEVAATTGVALLNLVRMMRRGEVAPEESGRNADTLLSNQNRVDEFLKLSPGSITNHLFCRFTILKDDEG